jgi:hypothetical protein
MEEILYLSLVTASISFTVTETKLFKPLRDWAIAKNPFIGELLSCGYCFGYWVAFALVALFPARVFRSVPVLDYFCTAFIVAWVSAFQWIALCWVMQKTGK